MEKRKVQFELKEFVSAEELEPSDRELVEMARAATELSWSPYSGFRVGAVARLVDGHIVRGANQENASYPAGICAERVLLSTAAALHPGVGIDTLAISYIYPGGRSDHPISPCGICRQSLHEFRQRTGRPIRLLLAGSSGTVQEIEDATALLPLVFGSDELKG